MVAESVAVVVEFGRNQMHSCPADHIQMIVAAVVVAEVLLIYS